MKYLWFLPLLWIAGWVHADTLRCGRYVVSEGMSPYEVVQKCGEPNFQQVVREVVTVVVNRQSRVEAVDPGTQDALSRLNVTTQEQAPVYRDIDRWTYDFGSGSLLRELDFYNGALIRIRTGGRSP